MPSSLSIVGGWFTPSKRPRKRPRRLLNVELLEDRLTPSAGAREQYMLELVNRMRENPSAELELMIHSSEIAFELAYFNVDIATLQAQWSALVPAAPLAWNDNLGIAAQTHNAFMLATGMQEHQLPGEADLGTRFTNAGYTGLSTWAENIYAYAKSVFHAQAGFAIDWGNATPGHRNNLMNPNLRDIGIGVLDAPGNPPGNPPVGPLLVTQDFGNRFSYGNAYLLGTVFSDANANGYYDQNEGLAGTTLSISGPGGATSTSTSPYGGYQVRLPPGAYTITASGGGLASPITQTITVGSSNVHLNWINGFQPQNASVPFGDSFNRANNGTLGAFWREVQGNFSIVNNLAVSGANMNSIAVVNGIGGGDSILQADINATTGSAGLLSRYAGAGDRNMYLATLTAAGGGSFSAGLYRNLGGVWGQLAVNTISTGIGTLRFETIGATLKLFFNNALVTSATDASLTSGGVGMRTWSQVTLDNFSANNSVGVTNATLPFSDPLASGTGLSALWSQRAGAFAIVAGKLQGTGLNVAVLNGIGQANVAVQADINVPTNGLQSAGLVARHSGSADDNMYLGAITGTNGVYMAGIYRNLGGAWAQLAAVPVGAGVGTLRFEAVGSSLKLFFNGQLAAYAYDSSLTTGTVGVRSLATATYTNFGAAALAPTTPGLPYSDDFSTLGAGSQLNSNWAARTGSFTLSSPGQMASASAGTSIAVVNGINQANAVVQADVNVTAAGLQSAGLVTRYSGTGDDNFYLGTLTGSGGGFTAAIFRNVNGAFTQLASVPVASGVGTLRFEAVGTALKLFINGRLVAYAYDSALTGGAVGMRGYNAVSYANFSASAVTPLTTTLPFSDNFQILTTGLQPGRAWVNRTGNFVGNGGGQLLSSTDPGSLMTLNSVNAANIRVQTDLSLGAGFSSAGLVTRYSGAGDTNMYLGAITGSSGNYTAQILRNLNGVWTVFASANVTVNIGTLRFESVGATHRLYWNNVLVASASDGALTSGSVGIRSYSQTAYDNFSATAL